MSLSNGTLWTGLLFHVVSTPSTASYIGSAQYIHLPPHQGRAGLYDYSIITLVIGLPLSLFYLLFGFHPLHHFGGFFPSPFIALVCVLSLGLWSFVELARRTDGIVNKLLVNGAPPSLLLAFWLAPLCNLMGFSHPPPFIALVCVLSFGLWSFVELARRTGGIVNKVLVNGINCVGEEEEQEQQQQQPPPVGNLANPADNRGLFLELAELLEMAGTRRGGNSFPTGFTGSAIWLAGRLGLRQQLSAGTTEGSHRGRNRNASGRRTRSSTQLLSGRRMRGVGGDDEDDDDDDDEDDEEYQCSESDEDDDDDDDDDSEGEGGAEGYNKGKQSDDDSENVGLTDHPLGHQIRYRTAACEDSARFGRVKPGGDVNTCAMLAGREMNASGNGKFSRAERCHVESKYLPTDGPTVVEQLNSRAYTGQFSSDGSLFVAGFQDQRIRIYNVEKNWKVKKDVLARNLRWTVTDTALSPDHRFLIYASITPLVHLVNVGSESGGVQSLANITDIHEGLDFAAGTRGDNAFGIWSLKFSSDGREILAGTSDKSIYVYDLEANKPTFRVVAHKDDVNAVAFADNSSNLIFSGSDDNNCKVWDRRTFAQKSRAVGVLEGHLEGITHIDSMGDGQYFISNSKDQTLKLWDIRKMSSGPPTRYRSAKCPAFRWDYRWDDYPGKAKGLKHPYDQSIMTYKGHVVLRTLIRCYFSPLSSTGQKYIYTGSHDGCVHIYDLVTGHRVAKLPFHRGTVRDVSWHPTQPMLVSSSWDGNIAKWEHLHGEKPHSSRGHKIITILTMDDNFDSD